MKSLGIIGCGARMKYLLSCLPALGEEYAITRLYDPRLEALTLFQELYAPEGKAASSWEEICSDPDIDWVFIASPNAFHADQAVRALENGKHLFCEKPLAISRTDCERIKTAAESSGQMFCIGFTLRFSPHYRRIKEIIDSGRLGKIISLEFNETLHFDHGGYIHGDWRRLRSLSGPHMLEKCSHDIDIIQWICGEAPSRVASFGGLNFFTPENEEMIAELGNHENGRPAYSAWQRTEDHNPFTADKDIVDNQVAILEFPSGTRATFHTNCNSSFPERRLMICGSRGSLRADVISGTIEVRICGYDSEVEKHDAGVSGNHGEGDVILGQELREAILHGTAPSTSWLDGYTSALTCFAIDEAMRNGRVINLT